MFYRWEDPQFPSVWHLHSLTMILFFQTRLWQHYPHNIKSARSGNQVKLLFKDLIQFRVWQGAFLFYWQAAFFIWACFVWQGAFFLIELFCLAGCLFYLNFFVWQGAWLGEHIFYGVHQQKLLGICHLFLTNCWGFKMKLKYCWRLVQKPCEAIFRTMLFFVRVW